ncbi:flagellar hook-basal body complex protein [Rubinisphaera margarita]|uniref:flagellar hook-basal body complex protein n=1 Tax=Rubinisphaera margarita TaxID=2909586 RepID=UPI001EE903AB|nr:flagellar hook-basal body complex protein [Rubinisphaera margarita]MCG6154512.1 flagellar hook-basal body complex protein [Rubinisphaera margarita]
MGLTSALTTSLNGLALNEQTIDVLGNNIANAGTNGFKASSVLFQTQLSRTLSVGSRPSADNGGTNPKQIGLGATSAAIFKDFSQGSITNSTSPSDLAIQGDGFFIVNGPDGNVYSRAGNFNLSSEDTLVTPSGLRVQGYGVDEDFNLVTTQLADIEIPLGDLTVAQQTRNLSISGAVLSTGELSTMGATLNSQDAFVNTAGGTVGGGDTASGATLLTSLYKEGDATPLFSLDDEITFTPRKGGRILESQTLAVTSTTTLSDLLTMMDHTLGIQSGGTVPQEGGQNPGITIDANGLIQVIGNRGSVNDVSITLGDLQVTNGSASSTVDLAFTKNQFADGESAITDFIVFDSLGQEVNVKMTTYLESRDSTSSTFRYFLESVDDSDSDIVLGNGTFVFDGEGIVTSGGVQQFAIDRNNTAAISPMQINIDLRSLTGISTKSAGSAITLQAQDGSSPGSLSSFVIDETGVINGIFDNGIIRTLGQVVLARFSNPQGLLDNGDTTFLEGVSSGTPFLVTPGNFGAGTIRAGSIELSNTDIGRNLVDLIVASTNYRGNARVIDSVQRLVDELLLLGR